MSVILGIDAAWAEKNPSGVAVVASSGEGWHCAGVAPNYDAFTVLAAGKPVDWKNGRFRGSTPDARALLKAANRLAGAPVDVVAIDLPISTVQITRRRAADQLISIEYGGRGCAVHNPNEMRPGLLGACLTREFMEAGYALAHAAEPPGRHMRLVEVYPHPPLLLLLKSEYRVPYKVGKSRKYWPKATLKERISHLLHVIGKINEALVTRLGHTGLPLPNGDDMPTLSALKRYEDALDTLVCAWVGICYVEGQAVAFGDDTAAIWCPKQEIEL